MSEHTFFETTKASIIAIVASSLSIIASCLILLAIFRSQIKLSSIYNRLMFGMSVMDIIGSIAMAFNNIPMPSDEIYDFPWAYGTVATCNLQGYSVIFGIAGSFWYICGLMFYYFCNLNLGISDHDIRERIEPKIHFICWIIPITLSTVLLRLDMYNPSPNQTWCIPKVYPIECMTDKDVDCIRGSINAEMFSRIFYSVFLSIGVVHVVGCMVAIIVKSHRSRIGDKIIRSSERFRSSYDITQSQLRKSLTQQALMYILAFLLTWIMVPISIIFPDFSPVFVGAMINALVPCQGFFNAFVFIYWKVQKVRASNTSASITEALRFIFITPRELREVEVEGLSTVDRFVRECRELCREEERPAMPELNHLAFPIRDEVVNSTGSNEPSDWSHCELVNYAVQDYSNIDSSPGTADFDLNDFNLNTNQVKSLKEDTSEEDTNLEHVVEKNI